ncbi:MAG: response regulator transcription factor [Filifactoraceae bacterium]
MISYDCLIVDDEITLLEVTSEYLNLFGIKTITAQSASECLEIIQNNSIKLILLDINLECESGFDICKKIRDISNIPIIFISARSSTDDMVLALHIGGDDYIPKPYALSYLLAKIQVFLKRYYPENSSEVLKVGKCEANLKHEEIYNDGNMIKLKGLEKRLLFYLIKNRGRTIAKEELFENVWQEKMTGDNTLNVHVRRLREKFELDPNNPQILKTVWGIGYVLVLGDEE